MRQQARDRVSFKHQKRSILPASPPQVRTQDGFAAANVGQRPRIRGTPKKPGAESAIHSNFCVLNRRKRRQRMVSFEAEDCSGFRSATVAIMQRTWLGQQNQQKETKITKIFEANCSLCFLHCLL